MWIFYSPVPAFFFRWKSRYRRHSDRITRSICGRQSSFRMIRSDNVAGSQQSYISGFITILVKKHIIANVPWPLPGYSENGSASICICVFLTAVWQATDADALDLVMYIPAKRDTVMIWLAHFAVHYCHDIDGSPILQHPSCLSTAITLGQGSGTYGSRARRGSFDDGIWLAWYFLNTIVTDETFSVIPTKPSATPCSARNRINSKKHVVKEKIQTFTIV